MSTKVEEEQKKQEAVSKIVNKMDMSSFTVHTMTTEEALKHLKTDKNKGLTNEEADKRLSEHGSNELESDEEKSIWARIAEQFEDELVIILLIAAVISFIIAITGKFFSFRDATCYHSCGLHLNMLVVYFTQEVNTFYFVSIYTYFLF